MEQPSNLYEWTLGEFGLDCSQYGCWNPAVFIVANDHPTSPVPEFGVCADHVNGRKIIATMGD